MNFNYRSILKMSGLFMITTGIMMVIPAIFAVYCNDNNAVLAFALSCMISVVPGFLMYLLIRPGSRNIRLRDGYSIIIFCWLLCCILGTLPYMISGQTSSFADALFESVSGYTTTSASTIPDYCLSNSMLLWRGITHWLGGLGILIFIISIMPSFGIIGQYLSDSETPGFARMSRMTTKMHNFSKPIIFIYLILSVIEFILLYVGSDMNAFDAALNTMGSVSTAGLCIHHGGLAYYNSTYIENIIMIFSLLPTINFLLYIKILQKNFSFIKNDVEIKVFLIIIFVATFIITLSLKFNGIYSSIASCLHHALLVVISFISTAGYPVVNYNAWPSLSHGILLMLLLIGGCIMSTSGSIKVYRVIIMFKVIVQGFFKRLHPRAMHPIKLKKHIVPNSTIYSISTFIGLYLFMMFATSLILSLQGFNLQTTMYSAASLMATCGPSLGAIGSTGDYSMFDPALKIFMSLIMFIGRLEISAVFLLFYPSFWNPNRARIK